MRDSSRTRVVFSSSQKKKKMWICSHPKISVFLLHSRNSFSAIFESLMFTHVVSAFVFEVSVGNVCEVCEV